VRGTDDVIYHKLWDGANWGSTSQHMSHSIIRLSCYLAVVCGVSLRQIALIFSFITVRRQDHHLALQAARIRERTAAYATEYARRAGVEGTLLKGYAPMGFDGLVTLGRRKRHSSTF